MILFLQGASHSGKTTFAKHLARLTGASVVSLDLLKMGLIKSGNTDFSGLTPEDDAAIAERLWPIVREMARVADENGQSLIIEGVSLPVVEAGRFAHGLGKSRAAAFAIVFSYFISFSLSAMAFITRAFRTSFSTLSWLIFGS